MDKKGCAVNAQYFTQVVEEEKDLLYRLAYNAKYDGFRGCCCGSYM